MQKGSQHNNISKLQRIADHIEATKGALLKTQERLKELPEEKRKREQELRSSQALESRLRREKEGIFRKKSELERRLLIFNKKEGLLKAKKKKVEEEERRTEDPRQRKIIEKRRWEIEALRRKIEERKWKIEDELKKVNDDLKRVERVLMSDVGIRIRRVKGLIEKVEEIQQKEGQKELFFKEEISRREGEYKESLEKENQRKIEEKRKEQEALLKVQEDERAKKEQEELEKKRTVEEKRKEQEALLRRKKENDNNNHFSEKELLEEDAGNILRIIESDDEDKEGIDIIQKANFDQNQANEKLKKGEIEKELSGASNIEEYRERLQELYKKAEYFYENNSFSEAVLLLETIIRAINNPSEKTRRIVDEIKRRDNIYSDTRLLLQRAKNREGLVKREPTEKQQKTLNELKRAVFGTSYKEEIVKESSDEKNLSQIKENSKEDEITARIKEEEVKIEKREREKGEIEKQLIEEQKSTEIKKEELKEIEGRKIEEYFLQAKEHMSKKEFSVAQFIIKEISEKIKDSAIADIVREKEIDKKLKELVSLVEQEQKKDREQKEDLEKKRSEEEKERVKREQEHRKEEKDKINRSYEKAKDYFKKRKFSIAIFILEESLLSLQREDDILFKTEELPLIKERVTILLEEAKEREKEIKEEEKRKKEEEKKRKEEKRKRLIDQRKIEERIVAKEKEEEKKALEEKRLEDYKKLQEEREKRRLIEREKQELEEKIKEEVLRKEEMERRLEEERKIIELEKNEELSRLEEEKRIIEEALKREEGRRLEREKRTKESIKKLDKIITEAEEDFKNGKIDKAEEKLKEAKRRVPERERNVFALFLDLINPSHEKRLESLEKKIVKKNEQTYKKREEEERIIVLRVREIAKEENIKITKEKEEQDGERKKREVENALLGAESDIGSGDLDSALVKLDGAMVIDLKGYRGKTKEVAKKIIAEREKLREKEGPEKRYSLEEYNLNVKEEDLLNWKEKREQREQKRDVREESFYSLGKDQLRDQIEEISEERRAIEKDIKVFLERVRSNKKEEEELNKKKKKAERVFEETERREASVKSSIGKTENLLDKVKDKYIRKEIEGERKSKIERMEIIISEKKKIKEVVKELEEKIKVFIINEAVTNEHLSFFERDLGQWTLDIERRKDRIENIEKEEEIRAKEEELEKKRIEEEKRKEQEALLKAQEEERVKKEQEELEKKRIEEEKRREQEALLKAQEEERVKKEQEELEKKKNKESDEGVDISDISFKL